MADQKEAKLFAFKLAAKQENKPAEQWKVRDGVAVAGCTGPVDFDNYREYDAIYHRNDKGMYC
ncbi:hypothetical protein GTP81_10590 [Rugamonas sp. FT107W]|uniref:Uncharacterized protein n=1 Tax=Duganella vulcania TaxID=2692166 RepID=A0A845HI79_9BURK|nr:hypothetical protein [Duganella vulcania]MYN17199.1 hypothetical protein [Duganella vulcania]